MENKINEAYIANFSKYMHLLSINETLAEIKKFKALINTFSLGGYHERKKINTLKSAKDTIKKLCEPYLSKNAK